MTDGTDSPSPPSPTPAASPQPRPPRVAAPVDGGRGRRRGRRHPRLTLLGVLVTVLLLLAAGAVAAGLVGEQDGEEPAAPCLPTRSVEVVVDPSLAPTLRRVAEQSQGTLLSTGVCAEVSVVALGSAEAAERLARAEGPLPALWVPDSSVWLGRAVPDPPPAGVGLTALGSLVSSPVVVAAGPQRVAEEGWAVEQPTWRDLLASGRPLATAEPATSAVSLQALVALQSTLTDPAQARTSLAQAAAALERGVVDDPSAALTAAAQDGSTGPLVPATEQQVFRANRGSTGTDLVALQPSDGPTSLDHPVVRVDAAGRDGAADPAAVEGVVRLLESAGRQAALTDGFRPPLAANAPAEQEAPLVPVPRSSEVDVLLAQLAELNRPSRVLVVLDASLSMRGVTGTGATRAQVVQQAVTDSLPSFSDTSSVGLWFFGGGLGGGTDHIEIVPLRSLDPGTAGVDQRAQLAGGADTLDERLVPGGTGLLAATLAAVRALQEDPDPDALASVLLVTDGREQAPGGVTLPEVVATLRAEVDPEVPVRVVPIGLGGDVDPEELRALAEATGGSAYLAEQAEDLPTVLTDALRRP